MPRIVVDVYERAGRVPDALSEQGVEIEFAHLIAGDYRLPNGVLVERKTIPDLHLTIERGRFWRQLGTLVAAARLPYLLIEGAELDISGGTHPAAVRGACIATLGRGIGIVWSRDSFDSALWLRLLAERASGRRPSRDRPVYAQRLKPRETLVREAMLACIPGISVGLARALLDRFGSVPAVAAAGREAWLSMPGIGTRRADALAAAFS